MSALANDRGNWKLEKRGMNKKRYVGCLSLLLMLFLSSAAIAQEIKLCDEGIAALDVKTYEILANVEISDTDVVA